MGTSRIDSTDTVSRNLPDLLVAALEGGAGLDSSSARELAASIINWGSDNGVAGDRYYWPSKFRELTPAQRDDAIRAEFNGNNLSDVCAKYDVSRMTVYRALTPRRKA